VATGFTFDSWFRKLLFAAFCLALAGLYFHGIFREYRAAKFAASGPAQLALALTLAPGNAGYQHRYGSYLFFARQEREQAIRHYQRATELNPRLAAAWLEQALAYHALNQTWQQNLALERALAVEPRTPDVAWEAGQQYLASGQTEAALRQFRVVIEHDPQSAAAALDVSWKASRDAGVMINHAVPASAAGRVKFLNYLVEQKERESAALAWAEVEELNQKFSPALALPYVEFLLTADPVNAAEALAVWRVLEKMDPGFPAFAAGSSIANAGFEHSNINAGFDWRSRPTSGANTAIDVNHAHSGSRSLGIVLDGTLTDDVGVFQYLSLQPNTRYEFSAYVMEASLAGVGGLRFQIADARSGRPFFTSPQLPETDAWQRVSGSFQTPKDAGLAVLNIVRTPAGQPLRGRFWIDDVDLVVSGQRK
jgi:tetratricopeptide (TPR) repeat protein